MTAITKRYAPMLLAAVLVLTSIACMAVNRLIFPSTPTPVPSPVPAQPTPVLSPVATLVPTPTPVPDDCPNGDCITACVDQLQAIAQPGAPSGGTIKPAHRFAASVDGYVLVIYTVSGDQIENPLNSPDIPPNLEDFQQDHSSQRKIWDYFAAIIPPEQRGFLDEYNVFTDGKDNILAFVSQSETDLGHWVLTIDMIDAANPKDLTFTLVHEFGHLLTLNPSQVAPSERIFNNPGSEKIYQQEAAACKTYFADEGCSLQDSYIDTFFNLFWPDVYAEWSIIDNIENQARYETALYNFYDKYADQFVSDYAPTNPVEDIAESFSFFIIQPKPIGDTIANQKVSFFYDFPELVQLRSQIGHRLCDQLKK